MRRFFSIQLRRGKNCRIRLNKIFLLGIAKKISPLRSAWRKDIAHLTVSVDLAASIISMPTQKASADKHQKQISS